MRLIVTRLLNARTPDGMVGRSQSLRASPDTTLGLPHSKKQVLKIF